MALYDFMTFFFTKKKEFKFKTSTFQIAVFLKSLSHDMINYNITFFFSRPICSCLFSHKIQIRKQNISKCILHNTGSKLANSDPLL